MKKYEIWLEGYYIEELYHEPLFFGIWEGNTFAEACLAWATQTSQPEKYNKSNVTCWGKKLYSSKEEAYIKQQEHSCRKSR